MPSTTPAIYDANGLQLGKSQEGYLFTNSVGDVVNQRMAILQFELTELKSHGTLQPKVETINTDRACMQAANEAITFMQTQVQKQPQPTWIAGLQDKATFNKFMGELFKTAAEANGVSPSKMSNAVETYNMQPASVSIADVSGKAMEMQKQMDQMDHLASTIDQKFDSLAQRLPPEKFKEFTRRGCTDMYQVCALEIGSEFKPKDLHGQPTAYDPGNAIHNLQALHYFADNPLKADAEGMRLYGPKAAHQLATIIDHINKIGGLSAAVPSSMQPSQSMVAPAPSMAPTMTMNSSLQST